MRARTNCARWANFGSRFHEAHDAAVEDLSLHLRVHAERAEAQATERRNNHSALERKCVRNSRRIRREHGQIRDSIVADLLVLIDDLNKGGTEILDQIAPGERPMLNYN